MRKNLFVILILVMIAGCLSVISRAAEPEPEPLYERGVLQKKLQAAVDEYNKTPSPILDDGGVLMFDKNIFNRHLEVMYMAGYWHGQLERDQAIERGAK